MTTTLPLDEHPLLRGLARVDMVLDELASLDPAFLPTRDKATALVAVERELARLEGLRLELVAAADDVACDAGARSAGAWVAHQTRAGGPAGVRTQRRADRLARFQPVGDALRAGVVNPAQADVIATALTHLPDDLDPELVEKAAAHLIAEAGHFAPRELQRLGRGVLEVVAPETADALEERLLLAEEQRGRDRLGVRFRPRGGGATDVIATLPDAVADRLRVYLDAYTSPRHAPVATAGGVERLPMARRRGEAFCALLEQIPADGLPVHGGTATSVMVTMTLDDLRHQTGLATTSTGGALTATEVRRLACTAGIIPVVLGGKGEVLDLGRTRRLFSPAQRKALAITDRECRTDGCDIPAAWTEAHHARQPWATGGRTDLKDGMLLCPFHHHRAHDPRYDQKNLPNGAVRFTRRT